MAQHGSTGSQAVEILGLATKDVLRGFRHVTLYFRAIGVKAIAAFPSFLRKPSKRMVDGIDTIAEQVERRTATVVHQYLDPDITRDSEMATFPKIVVRDDAARLFAKTTYDNLKLTLSYLTPQLELNERFFISEMLSACAYRKVVMDNLADYDEYLHAAIVLQQLEKQGAIRTHRSLNAARSNDSEIKKLTQIAYFSHMLWLLVARDYEAEREFHLLHACCDLSAVIYEQIAEAEGDREKTADLLRIHAEMV